ncbi:MAG: ABC transporter permease [Porcipelethomonas sp.]
MQVFKAFMKVMTKRIPVAMIWIGVFIAISAAMSHNSSEDTMFTDTELSICVFDEDDTPASKALTEFINKKHKLISLENDKDEILDALYYGRADYVLTILPGYSDKLAAGITDDLFTNYHVHSNYSSKLMENFLDSYTGTVSAYVAGGEMLDEAIIKSEESLSEEAEVKLESFSETDQGKFSAIFQCFFQYLPYVFISVMVAVLCPVILTLGNKEIRNRTNCSCISSASQTMQIFIGSAVFIIAVWILFMIAGIPITGGFYSGMKLYAVLNSFVFIIVSAGIALLIASFSPGETSVNVIANIVGLGMSFLCGVFVPQNLLGEGVLNAARFLPAYWYVKGNNMLCGSGSFSAEDFMKCVGIQMIFVFVLFALVMLITKLKHDKAE